MEDLMNGFVEYDHYDALGLAELHQEEGDNPRSFVKRPSAASSGSTRRSMR